MDELHANGKAAAAREAAQRVAEADLRAACTFRPSLSKVRVNSGIWLAALTGDDSLQQYNDAACGRSTYGGDLAPPF